MHRILKDHFGSSRSGQELEAVTLLMRSEVDVLTPRSLDEALTTLHANSESLKIVAGGSDIIVQLRDGVIKPTKLLNILPLKELRYIKQEQEGIHIGALSTYSDITSSELIRTHAWPLVEAASQIGAIQLQNTATLGGNLGNASPAGDSIPPLYALDAVVVARSKRGVREIPIQEFFVSYRKLALKPEELITEVHFKPLGKRDRGAYKKLGLREANAISIVDVGAVLRGRSDTESYEVARVALGAVAPTIRRSLAAEEALTHKPLTYESLKKAAALAARDAVPIDDIRGSAQYRKEVLESVVYEALVKAVYG
jgi:CO/xanthine dehydrogenase FAD-binding subunit